ncbi:glycerophosphodiester phosphodiesterase domain-containing protein 5-like [Sinocyclocheilus grahami]|uniref:glycerophosphodiester phosphodiesterase domain-containing protein 5-like n=1 Tax=Sinocyclocheilus grahami TaxID=75366 RepID=UPI0007AD3A38|nr:PREDICTED: glycerophosphodiester phosphodiesterase domain-containing protein 5-like [Sinocyclocheilus grahami]
MGATQTEPTLKLGKLEMARQRLLQRYEHQPFVSCLAGLYGCQWRRYQITHAQPGHCCCSKLECGSFALIVLTFCLSLVFLYFWSEAQNDYNDFDWFNFGNLGFWFPWSIVLLILAVFLFTYVAVLLLLAVCLLSDGQRLYLHWCHKIGISVTLILSIVASSVLTDLWSKEWMTVLLSFQVTAPYLHIGGVVLMTLLSWPIALHVFRINMRVRGMAIIVLYITVLVTLFLVPLGMYSPCIKERSSLGTAPALIGHRGAPMVHFVILLRLFRFKHQPLNINVFFYVNILLFIDYRKYAAANISTNLYVISQPWLYSLAWCAGAHSVATNAVHILKNLQRPLFLMTPDEYRLMWTLTDITSLILVVIIFVFHWWRERGLALSVDSSSVIESGSYRQFRTDMNDVWSLSNMSASDKQEPSL